VLRSHETTFPSNYNAFPPALAFATRFQAVSAAFPVRWLALREPFGLGRPDLLPGWAARLVPLAAGAVHPADKHTRLVVGGHEAAFGEASDRCLASSRAAWVVVETVL
jgi:hypothetical protein